VQNRDARNTMPVEVLSRRTIMDDFFVIEEVYLRHGRFDGGMTGKLRRLRLIRGDAAACLPYDPRRKRFFLVEQFRWPPYSIGEPGWLLEIPAGLLSPGEAPEVCMARELEEETGMRAEKLTPLLTFFSTPGGSTERIFLFTAEVEGSGAEGRLAGAPEENEDIKVRSFTYEEAFKMVWEGRIRDGKTILAILAFKDRILKGNL